MAHRPPPPGLTFAASSAGWQTSDMAVMARLRYYRVVYRGGIRLRCEPMEATEAAPAARVLPEGTVLRGAPTPDGRFVQLCGWTDRPDGAVEIDVDGAEFDEDGVLRGGAFGTAAVNSTSEAMNHGTLKGGSRSPPRLCLCQAWLPVSARGKVGLEEVAGRRDEAGQWWYRVVGSEGMQFAAQPSLDSPRGSKLHAFGTVVEGQRKTAPAGSKVTFVELEGGLGWLFEASDSGELLDRFNGKPVVAEASAEERTEGADVYFKVKHKGGLRVRKNPTLATQGGKGADDDGDGGALLLFNTVFVGDVILKPAGSDHTFVRLSNGRGWVCAVKGSSYGGPLPPRPPQNPHSSASIEYHKRQVAAVKQLPQPRLTAELLSSPWEELGDFWFQVICDSHPVPVLEAPSPNAAPTGKQMGLGMIFGSGRRVKPLGCPHTFVELKTADLSGWVSERAIHAPLQVQQQRRREEAKAITRMREAGGGASLSSSSSSSRSSLLLDMQRSELHQQHVVGMPPNAAADDFRWPPVLAQVSEPTWTDGPFFYQVLYPGGLKVRLNPHEDAASDRRDVVPPYSVVKVDGTLDVFFHHTLEGGKSDSSPLESESESFANSSLPLPQPPEETTEAVSRNASGSGSGIRDGNGSSISGDSNGVSSISISSSTSTSTSTSTSGSKRFLKLHGRSGWLLTQHSGQAVARRVAGAPAEDVGRFVYRVVAEGGAEVRRGPTATAPLLGCTLPVSTELTATLRLRFPTDALLSQSSPCPSPSSEASREDGSADGEEADVVTTAAAGGVAAVNALGAEGYSAADRGVFVNFVLPEGTRAPGGDGAIPSNKPIAGWLRVVEDVEDFQEDTGEGSGGEMQRSSLRVTPLLKLLSEEIDSTMAGVALSGSGGGGMIRTGTALGGMQGNMSTDDAIYHMEGGGAMLSLENPADRRCSVS